MNTKTNTIALQSLPLLFAEKINDEPNYFIEKIWEGFLRNETFGPDDKEYIQYLELHCEAYGLPWLPFPEDRLEFGKIHTLRKDQDDIWHTGTVIEFRINNDDCFQFAPTTKVISTQQVIITNNDVYVDERLLALYEVVQLAKNDGFDSIKSFYQYFGHNYEGKIIHWTNFRY